MDDAGFVDDLGIDSLDAVELIVAFEHEFDCVISEADAAKIRTVSDAIRLIEGYDTTKGAAVVSERQLTPAATD